MTKTQRDIIEGAGMFLVGYGLIWWIGLPWIVIALGVLCIIVGNCGKVDNVSSQHSSTQ